MFRNRLEFKGAVIGMILGDGCIPSLRPGRKTQHLVFAHKKDDQQYAQYKVDILNYLNETKLTESSNTLNGITYPCVVGRTLSHPFYNKIYDHMYYDNRKTVTEHVMKCLTPLGLALWYLDDGTLAGEMGWRNPFICSHNFNRAENELMCRELHKKFGITFRCIKKNIKNKTYFWMRLRRKDREKFFDIIKEFVPECMKRKIDPSFYESDNKYHDVKQICCEDCGIELEVKKSSIAVRCEKCNLNRRMQAKKTLYDKRKKTCEVNCVQCSNVFERKPGKLTTHCSKLCSGKTHSNMWKNKRSDAGIKS